MAGSLTRADLTVAVLVGVVALVPAVVRAWDLTSPTEVLSYLGGAAMIGAALRRHQPPHPMAWRALLAGLLVFAASSATEIVVSLAPDLQAVQVVETLLDLLGYVALLAAALALLVTRRGRWRRESVLDGATMLVALLLTISAWVTTGDRQELWSPEVTIGLPVMTALLVVAGVRLALPGSGRSTSGVALVVAGLVALVGYTGDFLGVPAGLAPWFDRLPVLAVVPVGLAALHPSMATLSAPTPGPALTQPRRVVGLGAALLLNPVLVLLIVVRTGVAEYWLALGLAALTLLTLWRIGALDREREGAAQALRASETRLQVLLEYAVDVVAIVGGDGRISYVNPAVEAMLGRDPQACLGMPAIDFVSADDRHLLRHALRESAQGPRRVDVRLLHADGSTRWVETIVSPRFDEEALSGHVLTLREVTDRKRLEDHLRRQASTDALTGLANRATFDRQLDLVADSEAGEVALLFVDLDGFKAVNDRLGHTAGDVILDEVARRLSACVRDTDMVARIGGDEFAIVLADGESQRAAEVARRCVEQVRAPMQVGDETVTMTASIGVAVNRRSEPAAGLLERADAAMYQAKRSGAGVHLTG